MSSRKRSVSPRRKRDHSSRRCSFSSDSDVESLQVRDPRDLPDLFGKKRDIAALNLKVNDERSVLQLMDSAFMDSPLQALNNYRQNGVRVKVWTRTHNNVRGILTGYIIAFDKHWNLIMSDCIDIFHKSKKSKTPFLRNVSANEALPDFPAKVMKKKEEVGEKTAAGPSKAEGKEDESGTGVKPALDPPNDDGPQEGKKKKRGKKKKTTIAKKTLKKIFLRGNNVIMIAPVEMEGSEEERSEKEP